MIFFKFETFKISMLKRIKRHFELRFNTKIKTNIVVIYQKSKYLVTELFELLSKKFFDKSYYGLWTQRY